MNGSRRRHAISLYPTPSIDDADRKKRADCLSRASFRVLCPSRRRAGGSGIRAVSFGSFCFPKKKRNKYAKRQACPNGKIFPDTMPWSAWPETPLFVTNEWGIEIHTPDSNESLSARGLSIQRQFDPKRHHDGPGQAIEAATYFLILHPGFGPVNNRCQQALPDHGDDKMQSGQKQGLL